MMYKMLSFALVGTVLAGLFPVSAFAFSGNLLSNASWSVHGGAVVDSYDKTIDFDEESGESQYAYQSVSVSGYAGKYIAIAAFSWAEDIESDGITGAPRIYGYFYNSQGAKISTLSASALAQDLDDAEAWDVLNTVVSVPSSAKTLRLYVEQQEDYSGDQSGTSARVYKIEVRGVNSSSEGRAFVNDNYWDRIPSTLPDGSSNDDSSSDDDNGSDVSCSSSRSSKKISVSVESLVYADDTDTDTNSESWQLWVANEDAWLWGDWGQGNALAYSTDNDAYGYMCARSGDELRINGSFDDATKWLVYRSSNAAADQVISINIDGRSYSLGTGKDCSWDSNGIGGYDIVCEVK